MPRAVHSLAVDWIDKCSENYPTPYQPRDADGIQDEFYYSHLDGNSIATRVAALAKQGSVMLLGSSSYMLSPTIAKLKERGVPFHNPYRTKNGAWNPYRSGVDRYAAFVRPAFDTQRIRFWTWKELHKWGEVMRADGFFAGGSKTLIATHAKDKEQAAHTLSREDVQAVLTPSAFSDLSACYGKPDARRAWFERSCLPSKRKFMEYALNVSRLQGDAALLDKPRVVVGTIHSVKGAEADSVVLFPDVSLAGYSQWLEEGDGRDAIRRVFYVGMTRARQRLTLCAPASDTAVDWNE